MSIDTAVLRFAGVMVLLSVVLTVTVSPLFVWFTVFVGLNLLQSSFNGFCPAAMVFRAMGVKKGWCVRIGSGRVRAKMAEILKASAARRNRPRRRWRC